MRKRRILASILAVALVLSLGGVNISAATGSPMTDAAEVSVPEGYIEHDYLKLYAFLEIADADGVKMVRSSTRTTTPLTPRPGVPPTRRAKAPSPGWNGQPARERMKSQCSL